MKEIKAYLTEDNKLFTDQHEAQKHETECKARLFIESNLPLFGIEREYVIKFISENFTLNPDVVIPEPKPIEPVSKMKRETRLFAGH